MKKLIIIGFVILFLVNVISFYFIFNLVVTNKDNILSNKELSENNGLKLDLIEEKIDSSENYEDEVTPYNCEFVRTLTYLSELEFQPDNMFSYYVFSQYQFDEPIIIRLEKGHEFSFFKNINYEITFFGECYEHCDSNFSEFQVINVIETDKVGMDQIQEVC